MKKKLMCTIILLMSVAPLHCMFRRVASWRPVTGGMSREAAARLVAAQQQERLSVQQSNALPGRNTSTWSGWFQSKADQFKSLFQRSPVQSKDFQQISYIATRTAPLGSRGFSTTIPQRASFWEKLSSYFEPKSAQEELVLNSDDINNLVWGHIDSDGVDAWGDKVSRMVFDKNDLQIAKERIGRFLEKNPEYKTDPIVKDYKYAFKFRNRNNNIDFTILDIVFLRLFEGDENHFTNPIKMSPSDSTLNQIELVKYLMEMGAQINPDNYDRYKYAYRVLMNNWSYKRLYESNTQTLYGVEYEIQKFKEIFKELDPILEKILPGFKNELETIQKERAEIEENPEIYRKNAEDAENKRAYTYAKARRMSNEYNRRVGDAYASYPNEFYDKVKFDEQEYQQWLKSGKNPHFFSEWASYQGGFKFEEAGSSQQIFSQKKSIQDLLPGLTASSSKENIAKAYRKYSMENHPDKLQVLVNQGKMTREDADKIIKKYKKINAAWDDYNNQLK